MHDSDYLFRVVLFCNNRGCSYFTAMADPPVAPCVTPELLDPRLDSQHRSFQSSVRGADLGTYRARVPLTTMAIDVRWLPRYGVFHVQIKYIIYMFNNI